MYTFYIKLLAVNYEATLSDSLSYSYEIGIIFIIWAILSYVIQLLSILRPRKFLPELKPGDEGEFF